MKPDSKRSESLLRRLPTAGTAPGRPASRGRTGLAPLISSLVLATLCLVSPAGAQSVYKWVDAQGRVHFGDPASAPRDADRVVLRSGGTAPAPTAGEPADDLSAAPDACRAARDRLDSYLNAGEIIETDSLGVERTLDDDRRAQLLARSELDVERACTAAP